MESGVNNHSEVDSQVGIPDGSEDVPTWIFDIEREEMVWANAAGRGLWEAESLQELIKRDFSADMSSATRERLRGYHESLARGESLAETWTFYPRGKPRSILCQCSPTHLADGRLAMRVDGIAGLSGLDDSALRVLESVHHADLLLTLHDEEGHVILRNAAAIRSLGAAGTLGHHFRRAEDRDAMLADLAQHGEAVREVPVDRGADTGWHIVQTRQLRDPATGGALLLTTEYDVTEHHQAMQDLATAKELIATLVDSLTTGVLFEGEDRIIRLANPAFCELFGISSQPEELVGHDCRELLRTARVYLADPDCFESRIETLIAGGAPVSGDEWELQDGRVVALSYRPLTVGERYAGHLWQYWDITDRRDTELRLEKEATRDWLTGLANARAVMRALRAAQRDTAQEGRCWAVLMIDVDHFKQVNDEFGHAAGDKVLVEIARAIGSSLRCSDSLGRIGGEEFLALLPDIDISNARESANRLRRAPRLCGCRSPTGQPVTVSVGLTLVWGDDAEARAIIDRADRALYAAKGAGRDRVMEMLQ